MCIYYEFVVRTYVNGKKVEATRIKDDFEWEDYIETLAKDNIRRHKEGLPLLYVVSFMCTTPKLGKFSQYDWFCTLYQRKMNALLGVQSPVDPNF